jgi:arylsulfatase A-like enzyme
MVDWLNPHHACSRRPVTRPRHYGKWHLHVPNAPLPPAYGYDEYAAFNLPSEAPSQLTPIATAPHAIDFIQRHQEVPFFINLWLHETRTRHYPLPEYLAQFESLDEQKQVYAAIVAEADAGVGRFLETLKELGLDQNTLVIFSSDNGPEWTGAPASKWQAEASTGPGMGTYYSVGETNGMRGRKRSLYAGGIRVPFIARWPGTVPAGEINTSSMMTAVDLLPTFLELAQVPLPTDYEPDGVSLTAPLLGKEFTRTQPIFWEYAIASDQAIT